MSIISPLEPHAFHLSLAALLLSTTTAFAQTDAASASASSSSSLGPGPTPSHDIVVTAEHPTVETSIDRKSYSLAHDLQASSGSAADVMRNLPSVSVDVDGNPSLRGDANVQILIDGQPAPQFNNANRGAALQQLGADGIERIEVLTNPPANFKPDGSAGIINIITKRRQGTRAATLQANVGSGARFNLGGTGNVQLGKLNLHGSATLRRDLRDRTLLDARDVLDATTGALVSRNRQSTHAVNRRLSQVVSAGADLDLSKVDRISLDGTYNRRVDHSTFDETDLAFDPSGVPTTQNSRTRPGHEVQISNSASLHYHHDVGKAGNGLTLLAQRSETMERQSLAYANTYLVPLASPSVQDQTLHADQVTREISLDYKAALPGEARLITGYDLQRDDNLYDNAQTLAVAPGAALSSDPNFTNLFRYGQTIQAFYGSYERPFGNLTMLAGVRLEQTDVQTRQITSAQRAGQSYFRAYPSLHLTEKVGAHQTLNLSYGRRVIRPDPEDLNPYPVQQDAFTLRQGNAGLRPQEIESYEAGWAYGKGGTARSVTLYLRRIHNGFTIVSTPVSPTLVVITEENLGKALAGGLEWAVSGKVIRNIDYNLSGNLFYSQIDAANLGFSGTKSGLGYEVKAALNWRATSRDTAQFNLNGQGKRLTPQGYRRGYVTVDLGVRHQLRPNLALTATISDIFATRRDGLIVNSPTLSEVTSRQQTGRIVFIGLSWALAGAHKKAPDKFDYEK